jgi:cell division protein ZipA
MRRAAISIFAVGIFSSACHRSSPDSTVDASPAASESSMSAAMASASAVLAANNLYLSTSSDADDRVAKVFPSGPASEDARAQIGTATAPPTIKGPDPTSEWIAQLSLPSPIPAEALQAALPASGNAKGVQMEARVVGTDTWMSLNADPGTTFDRLDIFFDVVNDDKTIKPVDIDRATAYARAISRRLRAGDPTFSMTTAQALAIASNCAAARKLFSDEDLDIGFTVRPKTSDHFSGKLVWDVFYSAGFRWGDGDYFHWIPSPDTDVSQGISMGTSTDPGYFLPESIADTGGDVEDVDMSFNAARTFKPLEMFDVMTRIGAYATHRLKATLVNDNGSPWDAKKERARLAVIDAALTAHGVTPGSSLALSIF